MRYSIESARALFIDTATPTKLLAWIAEAGEQGRTRKDITTTFFGGNKKATEITALLDQLLDAERITVEHQRPDSGKGRSVDVYTARTPNPTS